jgi:tRNA threonylcarbamoyladenosine biosynthesis protein TsaB
MQLYIDTTKNKSIYLAVKKDKEIIADIDFESEYSQAENLLPAIDKILKKAKIELADLAGIEVANCGEGFTALRIGIITANTLGYALNIPVNGVVDSEHGFSIIKPEYSKEPNITMKNK